MKKTCAAEVVFYARSGHSRRIAKRVRDTLGGALRDVKALADQSGTTGAARAGFKPDRTPKTGMNAATTACVLLAIEFGHRRKPMATVQGGAA